MNYKQTKKARVIQMAEQGFTRREIAKKTGLTVKSVGSILRMHYLKGQGYRVQKNYETAEDRARRELLEEGCDPQLVEQHFPVGA